MESLGDPEVVKGHNYGLETRENSVRSLAGLRCRLPPPKRGSKRWINLLQVQADSRQGAPRAHCRCCSPSIPFAGKTLSWFLLKQLDQKSNRILTKSSDSTGGKSRESVHKTESTAFHSAAEESFMLGFSETFESDNLQIMLFALKSFRVVVSTCSDCNANGCTEGLHQVR